MDINKRPQRKKTLPVKLQDSKETSGLKRPAKSKRVAKIAKLNDGPEVVNWMDPNEKPNVGALVDRGTPNEGVGNFSKPETTSSGMI